MHVVTIEPQQVFQALSDFTRLRILKLLVNSEEEICLCELSHCLSEPEYKLSRHIKLLRQTGLVSAEKEGRWIYHRIPSKEKKLAPLFKFISQIGDPDKVFQDDMRKFKKVIAARAGERCKVMTDKDLMKNATKAKAARL